MLGLLCLAAGCRECDGAPTFGETVSVVVASPSRLDLGDVYVGAPPTERTVSLESQGNGDVALGAPRLEGAGASAFSLWPDNAVSLPPGGRHMVRVRFSPDQARDWTATLVVPAEADNTRELRVELVGRGLALPSCDDQNTCTAETFDPFSGSCMVTVLVGPCDDRSACTQADRCVEGRCLGEALRCVDALPCTRDLCDPTSGCVFPADPQVCDDGNTCTVEYCDGAGGCGHVGLPDGTPCISGMLCELGDQCRGGVCVPREDAEMGLSLASVSNFGSTGALVAALDATTLVFLDTEQGGAQRRAWLSVVEVVGGALELRRQVEIPVVRPSYLSGLTAVDADRVVLTRASGGTLELLRVTVAGSAANHVETIPLVSPYYGSALQQDGWMLVAHGLQGARLDCVDTRAGAFTVSGGVTVSRGSRPVYDPQQDSVLTFTGGTMRWRCTAEGPQLLGPETAFSVDEVAAISASGVVLCDFIAECRWVARTADGLGPVQTPLAATDIQAALTDAWLAMSHVDGSVTLAPVDAAGVGTEQVVMPAVSSVYKILVLQQDLLVVLASDPSEQDGSIHVFPLPLQGSPPKQITGLQHGPMGWLYMQEGRLLSVSGYGARRVDVSNPLAPRVVDGGVFQAFAPLVSLRAGARETVLVPALGNSTSRGVLRRPLPWVDASQPGAPESAGVVRLERPGGEQLRDGMSVGAPSSVVSAVHLADGVWVYVHALDNALPGGDRTLVSNGLHLVAADSGPPDLNTPAPKGLAVDFSGAVAAVSVEATEASDNRVAMMDVGGGEAVVSAELRGTLPYWALAVSGSRVVGLSVGPMVDEGHIDLLERQGGTLVVTRSLDVPNAGTVAAFDGRFAVLGTDDGAGFVDLQPDPPVWMGALPLAGQLRSAMKVGTSMVLTTDSTLHVVSPPCPVPVVP